MNIFGSLIIISIALAAAGFLGSDQLVEFLTDSFSSVEHTSHFWFQFASTSIAYMLIHFALAHTLLHYAASAQISREQDSFRRAWHSVHCFAAALPNILLVLVSAYTLKQMWTNSTGSQYYIITIAGIIIIFPLIILGAGIFATPNAKIKSPGGKVGPFIFGAYLVMAVFVAAIDSYVVSYIGSIALILLFLSVVIFLVAALIKLQSRIIFSALCFALIAPFLIQVGVGLFWTGKIDTVFPIYYLRDDTNKLAKLDIAVGAWLDKQSKEDASPGTKIPIFLVSAQGGGMYAAYHTAFALARLNEGTCGKFHRHLFSISGVSGGALGGSLYTVLTRSHSQSTTIDCGQSVTLLTEKFFDVDLLSPMIANGLFVDLPRSIINYISAPLLRGGGGILIGRSARSLAFERAIKEKLESIGEASASEEFSGDFLTHWQAGEPYPALVFTSTLMNNGTPVIISPFVDLNPFPIISSYQSRKEQPKSWGSSYYGWADKPISLLEAVSISSRFPLISAPETVGWIGGRDFLGSDLVASLKLADGGFVDNSGIAATNAIIDSFQRVLKEKALEDKFRIVAIVIGDEPDNKFESRAINPDELSAPFLALYNVRRFHDEGYFDGLKAKGVDVVRNLLSSPRRQFALSWQLSKRTRHRIELITDILSLTHNDQFSFDNFESENDRGMCFVRTSLGMECSPLFPN